MGNANLKFPPTEEQLFGMQVARIIASIPSIIGAGFIVQHVLRSQKRRGRVKTRIMLGMSSMDLLFSCISVLSAVPNPTPNPNIRLASGNWKSCEATGFLLQGASVASIIYNGCLVLYYLLTIRFGWSESQIREQVEKYIHIVPLLVGWSIAVPGIPLELYNPTPVGCSIRSYPPGCPSRRQCIRAEHASKYELAFTYSFVWVNFVFLSLSMLAMYGMISKTQLKPQDEEQQEEHARDSEKDSRALLRRRFVTEALFYCLAFALTWIFGTTNTIIDLVHGSAMYIPITYLHIILEPLQGFWNSLIYLRPRYLRYLEKQRAKQAGVRYLEAARRKYSPAKVVFRAPVVDSMAGVGTDKAEAQYKPRAHHPALEQYQPRDPSTFSETMDTENQLEKDKASASGKTTSGNTTDEDHPHSSSSEGRVAAFLKAISVADDGDEEFGSTDTAPSD